MKLTLWRESVCMADDVEDHTVTCTIDAGTRFSDLFEKLIGQKYFPNISGQDAVWTLFCGDEDLISWKPKDNAFYSRFVFGEPAILSVGRWASKDLHFKYYSPALKRARYLFTLFRGSKGFMGHEGFMEEYNSYAVPKALEEEWRKTFTEL